MPNKLFRIKLAINMMHYLTVNTGAEIICFLIAVTCLGKDDQLVWRAMIIFLLLTCVTEMIGINIKHAYINELDYIKKHPGLKATVRANVWVYNILLIFQIGFISLIFDYLFKKYINSKPIIVLGLTILAVFYLTELIAHGPFVKHNITTIATSILFVLYSLFYYYLLIRGDSYVDLKTYEGFWWVAGTLLFYFGNIASLIFFEILAKINPHYEVTVPIYKILNIILYGCWSYSFICRRWLTTTSKSLS